MFSVSFVVLFCGMLCLGSKFDAKMYRGSVYDNAYALYMFPKCIDFDVALGEKQKELVKNGDMPECKTSNSEECFLEELMYVRSKVTVAPSVECLQQLNDFAYGGFSNENEVDPLQEYSYDEFV